MNNGFIKYQNGDEAIGTRLVKFSDAKHYILLVGIHEDENGKWQWRKDYYGDMPTKERLKTDIEELINSQTDESIIKGLVWNDIPVYLATENQINIKAAYDLAYQNDGRILPIRFKLGEDANGNPIYFDFTDMVTFGDFYTACVQWIQACINDGWNEKDSIDYDKLIGE